MSEILNKLHHEAMRLTIAQPSEETEGFVIHKTYEEFLSELVVQECMKVIKDFTCNQGLDYSAPVALARHFGVSNERTN